MLPDVYEIGMSHLGIQILYDMLNSFEDVIWCERVYSRWVDLDRIMRVKTYPCFFALAIAGHSDYWMIF